jgi:catechol 2,3-dioxygenase-like lactoylglutathione lyase family enzyme
VASWRHAFQPTGAEHDQGLAHRHLSRPDLDQAKAWYSQVFGATPYFDQPFYVGFAIGGFELG